MTRTHRSLHRIVWPILALVVAAGFALALWLRPAPDDDDTRMTPPAIPMERLA
jgi:hypothetical protein